MDTKEKNENNFFINNPSCPMVDFVNIVSGKWAIPILYRLIITNDLIRFGELQRAIGSITQKELTKQLRAFESLGLVKRTVYPEMPPRVEYCVTDLGMTLKPTLDSLANWMTQYRDQLTS
ncbi:helix-turn-helix transcriptional regulator [Vibrio tritonius]|uniref:Helix-turn-helix transcriptional regulator n=1 Tax=Vibrio tritonius TaxID=1435069 RepID=A0ABS7YQG4_9VIBR|nr:helix-turn-helix domain-containing protein [Vibrio tritonius]MCA2017212.1 helix-turn-helix transcriptional regulator [Vibrio tritonius]